MGQEKMDQGKSPYPTGQKIGAIEAAVAGVRAIAPGLSLGKIGRDLLAEGERQVVQGSAELGSALFQGSAYVPYGSGQSVDLEGGKESPVDHLSGPAYENALDAMEGEGIAKAEQKLSVKDIMAAGKEVEQARAQQRDGQQMER